MNFFQSFEDGINQELSHYLSGTAAALCSVIAPAVAAGIVIYIILIGFSVMRGEASDSLHSAMWKAIKWSLVAAVALSAGNFNTYVVGGLTAIESSLFQATTGSVSAGSLLDGCLIQYINLFNQLVQAVNTNGMGMFPNVAVCLAILLLAIASLIFFGLAVCVYMLATVAEVLVIALGPAFICTLIFPPLQRFADAWLSAALNTIIIKVLAGIVLTISVLFLGKTVQQVSGSFDTTSILMDVLKILVISVSFAGIFGYLPMLAAQLVGGAPLPHVAMPRFSHGRRSAPSQPSAASGSGGQMQQGRNLPFSGGVPIYRRNTMQNLNRV